MANAVKNMMAALNWFDRAVTTYMSDLASIRAKGVHAYE